MKKVKLLGVEITVRNKREETFVNITRQTCFDVLQWMDENSTSEPIITTSMEQRNRIATRLTNEITDMFRAMYFMDMTEKPNYFYLEDIIAWNGVD